MTEFPISTSVFYYMDIIRIAYLIKSDGNIDILGIFHGELDIENLLY